MRLRQFFALCCLLLLPNGLLAQDTITSFKTVAENSNIAFEVIWNGEPLKGKFERFEIDVAFHPAALEESSVDITVHLDSLAVENGDAEATLPQEEWLNSAKFPAAHFHAGHFKHLEGAQYQADGMLTLKGQTLPLKLLFTLDRFAASQANVTGHAEVKRNAFGIGWESTDAVADLVKIHFTLNALP